MKKFIRFNSVSIGRGFDPVNREVIHLFFVKKVEKRSYDKATKKPVIKASICNGEKVAGFQDTSTGAFEEVMLIKSDKDLESFMTIYGIEEKIDKIY